MVKPVSYSEPPVAEKDIEDTTKSHAEDSFEPTSSVIQPICEDSSLLVSPCISGQIDIVSGFSESGSTAGNDKDLNLSSAKPPYMTDYPKVYVKEEIESASEPETHEPWIEEDEGQMRSFTFIKVETISGMYDARQEEIENPIVRLQKVLSSAAVKTYDCDVCSKTFSNKRALIDHSRIHTGEKPYQCEYCSMSFARRQNLTRHRRTHTGDKPYECPQCKKCFSQGPHLSSHMKIHTGEKPHECELCKKKFAERHRLNRHMRSHTGEKRYQCELCQKRFVQSQNLRDHRRVHTREKPYECKICQRRFAKNCNLTVHLKIHGQNVKY